MDGSTLSLILIPITATASLATCLILVAYAASHPTWKHGPAAPQDARTTLPLDARIPLPRHPDPAPAPPSARTHGLDVLCSLTEMTARPIGDGGHGR